MKTATTTRCRSARLLATTALIPVATVVTVAGLTALPEAAQAQNLSIDDSDVTVNSPPALNVEGGLFVGDFGRGTLTISDGGTVSNAFAEIGRRGESNGTVTVTGTGSTWTNSNSIVVGNEGEGSLSISDGGMVSNSLASIGALGGSNGTVTVTGPGSTWTNSGDSFSFGNLSLFIGFFGEGTLTISDGGAVNAPGVELASIAGSTGTLNFGAAEGSAAVAAGSLTTPMIAFGAGTGTIVFNHTDTDFVLAAAISGNGTLRQLAGTTILTGANTYTGTTTISGGTLQIGNGGTTGTLGSGEIVNNGALVFNRSNDFTVGNIIGGSGSLTKRGAGTLTLTGANTYSGLTTVAEGTLIAASNQALGSAAVGTIVSSGATLGLQGFIAIGEPLTLNGSGVGGDGALQNISAVNTVAGTITLASSASIISSSGQLELTGAIIGDGQNLTIGGAGNIRSLSGIATGSGSLTKVGSGIVDIEGPVSYTGTTTVEDGSLFLSGGSAISDTGRVVVNGGTFAINNDETIGSLEGSGGRVSALGVVGVTRLTVGGNNLSTTYAGEVRNNGGVQLLALTKTGTGTLTLTGNNTFSGGTTITAGTLQIGDGGTTGNLGSGNVVNNANLVFNRSDDFTVGNVITGSGSLIKTGSGTLTLTGANTLIGTTTVSNGTLSIANGGSVSNNFGSVSGTVTVDGTGSSWTNLDTLNVDGVLAINNGGQVSSFIGDIGSSRGSRGTVTVSGTGSTWVTTLDTRVGVQGTGSLTINQGGTVNSLRAQVGQSSGSVGTVTVTGAGSSWTNNDVLLVGFFGTGMFNVSNGGTVNNQIVQIGREGGSSGAVIVDGAGSTWVSSRSALVGLNGTGSLAVTNGGAFFNSGSVIGSSAAGTGEINIAGAGSTWVNNGEVIIGRLGRGTVTVSNLGKIIASQAVLALGAGSTGTLIFGSAEGNPAAVAGTLEISTIAFGEGTGSIVFNHTSPDFELNAGISGFGTIRQVAGTTTLSGASGGFTGTTSVTGGSLLVNGTLGGAVNVTGGTLGGTGTLAGSVTIGSGGTLSAGQTVGALTMGSLALDAGSTSVFELGEAGVAGGANNDLIRVTGNLALNGGTINVVRGAGFGSGQYTLFEFGSLTGALENMTLNPLSGGFVGNLALGSNTVLLNTASAADLVWWNGTTTSATGMVEGGDGIWSLDSANFTTATGAVSGPWAGNGAMAVFGGTAGTVTIAAGEVLSPSGLNFLTDGYVITGGDAASGLELAGPTGIDTATGVGATIAAVMSGNGSLTKTGEGTLTLTGTNTYTGLTSVLGGTLANGGAIAGGLDVFGGATFDNRAGATLSGATTIRAGGTLTNAGTIASTVINDGVLTSTGAFGGLDNNAGATANLAGVAGAITNAGTITVTGNLTGESTISNLAPGRFTVDSGVALQALGTVTNSGTAVGAFTVNGTLDTTGAFQNAAGARLLIGATGTLSASDGIRNASGGFITNAGTINGAVINDFDFVSTGIVNGTLTNSAMAAATLAGQMNGAISNAGRVRLTGTTTGIGAFSQVDGFFELAGFNTTIGSLAGGGTVLLGSGTLTLGGDNTSTRFGGVISGSGGLIKTGSGTFTLTGPHGYTGLTEVLQGTLVLEGGRLSGSVHNDANVALGGEILGGLTNNGTALLFGQIEGAIVNAGSITTANGAVFLGRFTQTAAGTLDLGGANVGVGSLAGEGTIALGGGFLAIGFDNTDSSFAGVISGAGGVVKRGSGTFTLTGANASTLGTIIDEGGVTLAAGGTMASRVLNRASFTNAGTVNGGVDNLGTFVTTGTVVGNLRNEGTGTASLSGALMGNIENSSLIALTGTTTGIGQVQQASGGMFDLAGFDTAFGGLSGSGSVSLGAATLTLGGNNANSAFGGLISGTGGLTKVGSGTFVLSGAQSYTGLTRVDGGTFVLADGQLAGSVLNNANIVMDGRVLGGLTNNGAAQIAGQIDGAVLNAAGITGLGDSLYLGRFTQTASGNFNLAGFNAGVGSLSGEGLIALGTGFLTVGSDNSSSTFDGVISGAGELVKVGNGVFTVNGVNTYTGTTFVNVGTLVIGGDGVGAAPVANTPGVAVGAAEAVAAVTIAALPPEGGRAMLGRDGAGLTNGRIEVTLQRDTGAQSLSETADIAGDAPPAAALPAAPSAAMNSTLSGAVIAGRVVNNASVINNGTILGQLFNNENAVATNHGVIAGMVMNNGILTSTGTLGGGLANNGTAEIEGVLAGEVFNSGAITLTGTTTGISLLEQTAAGVFDLAGFDTSIGVLVGAGRITLGNGSLTTGTDDVASLFSGVISGSGGLIKAGSGRLVLTGANTYSGGTTISGGTLQLGDGGTSGSIIGPVVNNGALVVNRSNAYTFDGVISGSGLFVQSGTGTTTLTGANSYTGGTLVLNGRLVGDTGSLQGAIRNDAELEFALASDGTFAGMLMGSGRVEKTGAGVLTFAGDGSLLSGPFAVLAGGLRLAGRLDQSAVTLARGTTLSGNGIIGGLVVESGALVTPGTSIGTIGVAGNVTFMNGSRYLAEVSDLGSDLISATGTAQLSGALDVVNIGGARYSFNRTFSLIEATGGISGSFDTVSITGFSPIYRPTLRGSANGLDLVLAPNSLAVLAGPGLTGNQAAVAARFDAAVDAGFNPQAFFEVYSLAPARLAGALDQLSGEVHPAMGRAAMRQSRLPREAVLERAADQALAEEAGSNSWGGWGKLMRSWGDVDSDGSAAAQDTDTEGFIVGFDGGTANDTRAFRAGVYGSYLDTRVRIDARGSSGRIEQTGGGVYASLALGGLSLVAGGGAARFDIMTDRALALPGLAGATSSLSGGDMAQVFGRLGYRFDLGAASIEPFVAGDHAWIALDQTVERGGAAALSVGRQEYKVAGATAGLAAKVPLGKLRLDGEVATRFELGDRAPAALIALAEAPGQATRIAATGLNRTAYAARLGAVLPINRRIEVRVDYSSEFSRNDTEHAALAGLSIAF